MCIAVDLIAEFGHRLKSLFCATTYTATLIFAFSTFSGHAQSGTDGTVDIHAGIEIQVEILPEYRYLEVIDALDRTGYQILSVSDTLLNRVRIRARSVTHLREIVISRATGSILRDVVLERYDR